MIYEEESFKIQGLTNTIGIILSKDFKEESKSWESYLNKPYKILPTSDRMGLRLEGHPIHIEGGYDILSSPVSYGSIQVPASGQPMILTSDCQTTGGYKVMGKVCEADMMKVVQCGFGASVYFEAIDVVEAQRRLKDLRIKLKSGLKIIEMRERHFNIKVGDQSYLVHVREM